MKVWELKEGVEYIIGNRCVYKIERGELLAKFVDDNEWEMSAFTYSEIMNLDFTIYTPPTNWSKVEVDDRMLVSQDGSNWHNRHFAKYDNGRVYTWSDGCTSFTIKNKDAMMSWNYAKLYKEE